MAKKKKIMASQSVTKAHFEVPFNFKIPHAQELRMRVTLSLVMWIKVEFSWKGARKR